ncbi:MAG: hypothetical protein DKT66_04355 [Candidatus Melainabacteria bacterium]|nr:MAG: hypothetical protein DKT66_04355 [Candidatus Melainabacteria bacterium]
MQLIGYTRRKKYLVLSAIVSLSVALSTIDTALVVESWQRQSWGETFQRKAKIRGAGNSLALPVVHWQIPNQEPLP